MQFIDKHVGVRIQLRRMHLGLTIDDLGNETGWSAIQVQRYEQGLDRVHASKLFDLATVLGVPVTYFFEDLVDPQVPGGSGDGAYSYDKEATDLIAAYCVACANKREEIFLHTVASGRPHNSKLS